MKIMASLNSVRTAVCVACIVATLGCSSGDPLTSGSTDRQTRVIMNLLSQYYGEYLQSHSGKPPKDANAFREYVESRSEEFQRYNIQELDQLLISPRDQQPFVIVTGKRVVPSHSPGMPWAAYEQTGLDGVVMAVQVRGGVHDLSAEELGEIIGQGTPVKRN